MEALAEQEEPKERHYAAFVDGGCTNNGGAYPKGYYSFMIFDQDCLARATTPAEEIRCDPDPALYTGMTPMYSTMRAELSSQVRNTNNLAEAIAMQSLIIALINMRYVGPHSQVMIYCDSLLVINQLKGYYKTNNRELLKIHKATYSIIDKWAKAHDIKEPWEYLRLTKISGDLMKQVLGH